ncbi:hypothetical protein GSI_05716 [Ganoderma sinense ZZ0214-1]|uniref:Uncharacterized protein n=1 Tax=Ganoderma sinense ZZ0214-1 TaxID=1077348 RepID=A0A2G8SBB5_9APHY|nr:hypothetical protein GSI_05716 [Ganoderma sinense ZZ0214-1]
MDFNTMIQHTTRLEEYTVPVAVLLAFLLLIHQRHRFLPAASPDFNERYRRSVRPSGHIQRAASVAVAASAAVYLDELDADDTSGPTESEGESEGALEFSSSPSETPSSKAETDVFNGVATRAGSLYSLAEESPEAVVGVRASTYPPSSKELESSTVSGGQRDLRHSTRSRSVTASSTSVRSTLAATSSASKTSKSGLQSSASQAGHETASRIRQTSFAASPSTTPQPSRSSVQRLQPKVESDDDDDYVLDTLIPASTPLPPKRASTPRTPAKARFGRVFTPEDNLASDDLPPSSPLPPKQPSASARTPHSAFRDRSVLSGPSSVGSQDADDEADRVVVTAWFESSSDKLVDSPPDLRDHPDLRLGDLFYHSTANDYQLWIWEVNDHGVLCWVRVKFMSVRNGLYLTLTPGERRPSWGYTV